MKLLAGVASLSLVDRIGRFLYFIFVLPDELLPISQGPIAMVRHVSAATLYPAHNHVLSILLFF